MGSCSLASASKQEAVPGIWGEQRGGYFPEGQLCTGYAAWPRLSQRPSEKLIVIIQGRNTRRTFRVVPTPPTPSVEHRHTHPPQVQWVPVPSSLKGHFPTHPAPLGSFWGWVAELGASSGASPWYLVPVPPAACPAPAPTCTYQATTA